ncbi:DUF883 family protein [Paraburkholderia acidipaludis]|uniref:DUF883 family protein n=1 Tax=Paraburkholderia acidipaludis TaxID=660537 RepID=UPI0004889337|nr:DUF883 family protein [Paraburkholderia acidipaludis]
MSAFPNTRDALGESWTRTGHRARRIARRGRSAAADIADELRELLGELEKSLGEGTQADAAELRADLRKRLDVARERLEAARAATRERADEAIAHADDYVRANPWQAIAIVGGVALIAGALIARSR